MKYLFILIIGLFTMNNFSNAQQNHVPNGNFEFYSPCPTSHSQVSNCIGWRAYHSGSSDYFNSCATVSVDVPSNTFGYQQPASGQAYMGGATSNGSDYKEYIATAITPLLPGATYEVSMSVSLSNNSRFGTMDLGVHFYDVGPTTTVTGIGAGTLSVTPKISYSNYGTIIDTTNWIRLTKTFVADSAYDNIVIGGFSPHSVQVKDTIQSTGNYCYYYIDSVVIKLADSFTLIINDSTLCAGDTLQIPYLAIKNYASNNVFTAQLSNASGSFSSPVNIGSRNSDTSGIITVIIPANTTTSTGYKIRLVASNFADTTKDLGFSIKIGGGIIKPVANNNGPICSNDTLKLTATTTTSGVSYKWGGPGSYNSNLQNPTINTPVIANTGNYIVTATLHGCEAKDTTSVVVFGNSGPTGTIATTNAPICTGDSLKLFGTANGIGNTYSWTGPNGFNTNLQNLAIPVSTSLMSGEYVLYASNGNCVSRDTVTVLVKPYPEAFTAASNIPCIGETINFTATSTSTGVTFAWTGPNGFNTTGATPFIGGAGAVHNGNYFVTATLNGCSSTDTVMLTVKPLPAKPVANYNTPICAGETINLTATTTTSGVTYSWTGPNSYTSSIQNPTISNSTVGMSGDYIVAADLNGCKTTDTTTVTVKPLPTPVTLSNNSALCAGDTLKLYSTASTTGATYTWAGPNNFSASAQNAALPNSTANMTGWYKITVDLNACQYKDSTYATVHPIPATPLVGFNNPLCVGETLNLTASTVSGAIYSWTGANSFTANTQNPARNNITTGDAGVYNVTATVNGCTSPAGSATITINPSPFVVIFPTPGDSICQGDPVVFTALPNNAGGAPQYRWLVNAQQVGTGTVFNTSALSNGDVVRCDMTEYTKCSSPYTDQSNDIEMKVLPWLTPSVTISASPNRTLEVDEYVTFTATPTNGGPAPLYQWKRNGQNIQGATGSVWSANTLNDNDKITAELISNYKCPQPATAVSNTITVRVATSIKNTNAIKELSLYPNPNNGSFTIKGLVPNNNKISVLVMSGIGQLVYKQDITPANNTVSENITLDGGLASGVYFVRLVVNGEARVIPMTVSR